MFFFHISAVNQKEKKLFHFCLTFRNLAFIKNILQQIQHFTTIHNKLSFFTILLATMLFLSYKLITIKSSIEPIKHSNTVITFKQISIPKAVIRN